MARPAYNADEREAIEERICSEALALFAKNGYRSVSLRAIAKELGWSAPALYRYYDNKDALLAAIRADGFLEIRNLLAEVRSRTQSGAEAAAQSIKVYVAYALEQSALYQLMYELDQAVVASTDVVYANRSLAFAEAIGIADDVLTESGASGDSVEMAHVFWINAHGLAALAVANQLDLGRSLDELIDPTVRTLLRGLNTSTLKENTHV
jgi:AcrR family transcriptional regulator